MTYVVGALLIVVAILAATLVALLIRGKGHALHGLVQHFEEAEIREDHKYRMMETLGIENSAELIHFALTHHLIP